MKFIYGRGTEYRSWKKKSVAAFIHWVKSRGLPALSADSGLPNVSCSSAVWGMQINSGGADSSR